MKPQNITELVSFAFRAGKWEEKPRIKDIDHVPRGERHLPVYPRYIGHTYEIKGGKSGAWILSQTISNKNPLLEALMRGKKIPVGETILEPLRYKGDE